MSVLSQNQLAIEQHSVQATEFAERYSDLEKDPFKNCFTYSRYRLDQFLDRFLEEPTCPTAVLDVGCGTGPHMRKLRKRGYQVAGMDGSPEMLEEARLLNPKSDIRLGEVDAIPFEAEAFDVVLCIEVLRYLENPLPCLREIHRVLKPGGVALVTAAPLFSLNGYWMVNRLANRIRLGNLVRLKQFFQSSNQLHRLCRQAKFSDVDIHGVYWGPINWVERLTPFALTRFLQMWFPLDRAVADRALFREFCNMFLVRVRK